MGLNFTDICNPATIAMDATYSSRIQRAEQGADSSDGRSDARVFWSADGSR